MLVRNSTIQRTSAGSLTNLTRREHEEITYCYSKYLFYF